MGDHHSRWVLALELGSAVMIGAGVFAVLAVLLGAVAPKEVESLPRVGPAVARLLRTVGPRGVQR